MTKEQAEWVERRSRVVGQCYWLRLDSWPMNKWVAFQRGDQGDWSWRTWKLDGGYPVVTCDGLHDPADVVAELDRASMEWASADGSDCLRGNVEAISMTMAADTMDSLIIGNERLVDALLILDGARSAGSSDEILAAQMIWHSSSAVQARLNWRTSLPLSGNAQLVA